MYRIDHGQPEKRGLPADEVVLPFAGAPGHQDHPPASFTGAIADTFGARAAERPNLEHLPASAEDVLDALDDMSRRIDHLARELRCLGWFDDDDDRPRAA